MRLVSHSASFPLPHREDSDALAASVEGKGLEGMKGQTKMCRRLGLLSLAQRSFLRPTLLCME